MSKQLDFDAIEKAIASLEKAIVRSKVNPADDEVRDAVIQRFEYTYELAWKMLKRRIELDAAYPAEVDGFSFKQLIREGAERGFLDNPEKWFSYREQRNITSHTYNEAKAQQVYLAALNFLDDAKSLLATLKKHST